MFQGGQVGHKANDPKCPMYNKNKKTKFKGKCNLCGMKGHKEADCFEKDENASKRPKNWTSKLDRANATTNREELLLMAKDEQQRKGFNTSIDLLKDPNCFIYDTGATCVTTFSDIGMSEWKDNEETSITYGNGSSETAKEGELTGITCNKYGQELSRVKMKGVKYVPESAYNLFSVTQRVNQG